MIYFTSAAFLLITLGHVHKQTGTGVFSYTPGSWSSFTGTGAGDTSAYSSSNDPNGLGPSITLTSPASGDTYTLGASYSFTIVWTPSAPGNTPTTNVVVTFHRQGTLTVGGNGISQITSGASALLEMDSTNNFLSGATSNVSDITMTLPLTEQTNGTWTASGSFLSDTLNTTYNSSGGGVTSCQEIYQLGSLTGSN